MEEQTLSLSAIRPSGGADPRSECNLPDNAGQQLAFGLTYASLTKYDCMPERNSAVHDNRGMLLMVSLGHRLCLLTVAGAATPEVLPACTHGSAER